MEKFPIKTRIKYNGNIYEITGFEKHGYNVSVINPINDEYATLISYKAPFVIISKESIEEKLNKLIEEYTEYEYTIEPNKDNIIEDLSLSISKELAKPIIRWILENYRLVPKNNE